MEQFAIEQLGVCDYQSPLQLSPDLYRCDHERLILQPEFTECSAAICEQSLELTGPRKQIYFNPAKITAAIVTCGGLCPGINAVIRGLVMQLGYNYGCQTILGIRYGYWGLGLQGEEPWQLTPDKVSGIKGQGGTLLGSSRGTPPTPELVDGLQHHNIDLLFVIGGDGTMRGAHAIWQEVRRRQLCISVIGVPKTIDNDIPYVRRTFGFETAVAEAAAAINVAETEANGTPYGIGLVKLMGRHAGFIAAAATVASGQPNYCLIPEVPFELDGEQGLLANLHQRLLARKHAVIVVAEGAGQDMLAQQNQGKDASGNAKLGDIGQYLKARIQDYFQAQQQTVSVKYIEPSYLIRSAPPNASDQLYCDQLARAAVHAGMAGKGGMLIGNWNGRLVHVPIQALQKVVDKRVNPYGELWFSVLENTGQPSLVNG
ncbi:MAG TPA: ATP-dependent 6-phosphofructokinase [Thiothrix sp.]|nr:ATP-dependent 6-phosphofructokinase [Thiothrix sp.]